MPASQPPSSPSPSHNPAQSYPSAQSHPSLNHLSTSSTPSAASSPPRTPTSTRFPISNPSTPISLRRSPPSTPSPSRFAATPYTLSPPTVLRSPRPPAIPQFSLSNMVFTSQSNYLAAKVDVNFEQGGVVDMIGGPNTGTSYSLPGHIVLTFNSLPAPLEGRLREIQSLEVVMEGKSEFWDDAGRYTPMRLHSQTLSLATPSSPLLIPSTDPSRPHAAKFQLALPFDMRLPGWLPSTQASDMTATSYGCLVKAVVGWTGPSSSSSAASSSSSASSDVFMDDILPSRPYTKTSPASRLFGNSSLLPSSSHPSSSKFSSFTILRHRIAPPSSSAQAPEVQERHFTLKPEKDSTSPVECVVSVPEFVDVNGEEKSLKISLRIRARKDVFNQPSASSSSTPSEQSTQTEAEAEESTGELESVPMERESRQKKKDEDVLTRMVELGMEVEEVEWFSSTPSASFLSTFPVPDEQPSTHSSEHKLLSPPSPNLSSVFGQQDRPFKGTRSRSCLLSEDGNQRNFFFADEGLGLSEKWRKVNVVLPMPELGSHSQEKGVNGRPQAEYNGPFMRVKHTLKIRIVCKNAHGDDAQVVLLSTPIRFATCPTTLPSRSAKTPALPAYIQLFLENGDLRECDPLPLYEDCLPPSPPAPTPAPSAPVLSPGALTPLALVAPSFALIQPTPTTATPSYQSIFHHPVPVPQALPSPSPSTSSLEGCSSRSASPTPSSFAGSSVGSTTDLIGQLGSFSSPLPSFGTFGNLREGLGLGLGLGAGMGMEPRRSGSPALSSGDEDEAMSGSSLQPQRSQRPAGSKVMRPLSQRSAPRQA
ncbi:hypothetical protein L198_07237 [Cryptococcus wingfieldii CBS 7118]|uniref:Uncharacterized protein n=1 Tax=Cryptococcus wingfieldii CBS 7118 TaxID=1295528 RepID=A0A1E3ID59_9TREE|nr:hypothetical protein L198_07237 [Cryptococcus wingfieldii CBS 7118]ODN86543.1 hypothetical protein L198_07237 [Cryptococcus wingfieldii CBS 7118]